MPAVVRTLLASPLAEDHDLSFLTTHRSQRPWTRLITFAVALLRLIAWCLGRGPRIVHVHTATRGSWYRKAVCVWTARRLDRPVVLHFHGGEGDMRAFADRLSSRRLAPVGAVFLRADRVLAVSVASAAEVERLFGLRDVLVVPNAAPEVLPADLAGRVADRETSLVYLGGFANPAKGADTLLDALPNMLERSPGVKVVLAGPGEPPARATALLASSRVRWEGYLDATGKAEVLRDASVFLMPSVSEGMPVALLEAMAYGLAIVATRVGGIPEVVTDGETAVLVEPLDPAAFERAVTGLLADSVRRERLGAAARLRAERLNAGEVFGPIESVYRSLSPGSSVGSSPELPAPVTVAV